MIDIFQLIGILGLISIIIGILLTKKSLRVIQYIFFIAGGIGLLIYSIYIKDTIFIILQSVYTLASIYGLIKVKRDQP